MDYSNPEGKTTSNYVGTVTSVPNNFPPNTGVCQHCGHCPHCGRGGYVAPTYPYQPYYPNFPSVTYTTPPNLGLNGGDLNVSKASQGIIAINNQGDVGSGG